MKKMIAMDLDGTLLNIDKKISLKSKEYLMKLKEEGYIIVIATGRVLNSALDVTEGAMFADYVVGSAGGIIYDRNNNEIIYEKNISKETLKKVLEIYNEDINYISVCDSKLYYKYTNKDCDENEFNKRTFDKDFLINDLDVIHMDISINNNIDNIYNYLKNNINDVKIYIMADSYNPNRRWIEINGLNINKFEALKKIALKENIEIKDIISFGDSINDIEMIENAGVSVAMGNAIDELKKEADYVTTSHNEDGIIKFLEEYLK